MISLVQFRQSLANAPVVPVLTVPSVEHAAPLADTLKAGGLASAEVTLRTPASLEVIQEMKRAQPELIVGAGTILSGSDVNAAIKAGADFLVTPGAGPELLSALGEYDGVILPGISTASEAMSRFEQGYGVMKFFPAEAAGGAPFLKSLAGPLPHIDFMPTGGVTPENLADYLSLPNVIAVGGTWIAREADLHAGDWVAIEGRCREAASLAKKVLAA